MDRTMYSLWTLKPVSDMSKIKFKCLVGFLLECFLIHNGPLSVRNGLWHVIKNGRMWIGNNVEVSSCGHLLLELLWKETAVVIYCWNYLGRKQLW